MVKNKLDLLETQFFTPLIVQSFEVGLDKDKLLVFILFQRKMANDEEILLVFVELNFLSP